MTSAGHHTVTAASPAASPAAPPGTSPGASQTIAVDLLGGDLAPDVVVDGALLALRRRPDVVVTLVGPPETAGPLLAARGHPDRLGIVAARQSIRMDEDPVRAVRSRRDATVRVAARLVRDGAADATVSIGSTGAALAAASSRSAGCRASPAPRWPSSSTPRARSSFSTPAPTPTAVSISSRSSRCPEWRTPVALGIDRPRVGLLTIGTEPGKGDAVRKAATTSFGVARQLPVTFVGNVEPGRCPWAAPPTSS